MPVKLDASGNIDTAALEGDLRCALAADTEYRRTDNMKKRAVRVAKSYDEFKNMVACANLTPVSREEMESLGAVKRGWRKQAASSKGSGGLSAAASSADGLASSLLIGEVDVSNGSIPSVPADALKPDVEQVKPTRVTAMDFLKHWKRLPSQNERFEYLEKLGIPSICSVFKKTCEVDVLEQVLQVVMDCAPACRGPSLDSDSKLPADSAAAHSSQQEWVQALASLPSFGFNVNFLNPTLRNRIKEMLQNSGADESVYTIFSS